VVRQWESYPRKVRGGLSKYVDIPIFTGLGSARNNINVLSSRVVIGVGMGPGTASELSLAIKARKPIILLQPKPATLEFFQSMSPELVFPATDVTEVVDLIIQQLDG